jgi:hypothetical protein
MREEEEADTVGGRRHWWIEGMEENISFRAEEEDGLQLYEPRAAAAEEGPALSNLLEFEHFVGPISAQREGRIATYVTCLWTCRRN